jgi:hypothetical protein
MRLPGQGQLMASQWANMHYLGGHAPIAFSVTCTTRRPFVHWKIPYLEFSEHEVVFLLPIAENGEPSRGGSL